MNTKFISERIAQLRTLKGVSARDMSLSIGQNTNYINGIENGKTLPSMQGFLYICEYFGITPQEFFLDDKENPALINEIVGKMNSLSNDDLELVRSFVERLTSK